MSSGSAFRLPPIPVALPLLAALSLLLGPSVAAGAPKPVGDAFTISTCPTCSQERPAISLSPVGGVVAWHRFNGRGFDLFARTIDPASASPHIFDLVVHDGDAILGSLSTDLTGANWLTWASLDSFPNDLFGERYSRAFSNLDFRVGGGNDAPHLAPGAVAGVDGNALLLTFEDLSEPADSGPTRVWIWSIRFPSPTQPQVIAEIPRGQGFPRLCRRPNGSAVLVWQTRDLADRLGLSWALVGPDAAIVKPAAPLVASGGLASEPHHEVACGKDGGFIVTWQTTRPPAKAGSDIVFQRFDKRAKPAGPPVLAAKKFAGDQTDPALVFDPTGSFVIAWKSVVAGSDASERIFARRFASNGAAFGSDLLVEIGSTTSEVGPPDVAAWGNAGRFVVVWEQDDVIRGRRFQP